MGMKKYTVRLYQVHDKDLIHMLEDGIHLMDLLYQILSIFVSGEKKKVTITKESEKEEIKKRVVIKSLSLHEEEDKEIIGLLDQIEDGARNWFLKNLLRRCMGKVIDHRFLKDPATEKIFLEKNKVFCREPDFEVVVRKHKKKTGKKVNLVHDFDTSMDEKTEDTEEKKQDEEKKGMEKQSVKEVPQESGVEKSDILEEETMIIDILDDIFS